MTIRKNHKDHLAELAPTLALAPPLLKQTDSDSLTFWTQHPTKSCFVDLTPFAEGQMQPKQMHGGNPKRWNGSYKGRPKLIRELLPSIRDKLITSTESTCGSFIRGLREWWRLFDELELRAQEIGLFIAPVSCVTDLSHIHQQVAVQRLSPNDFSSLTSVANTTRRALKLHDLGWAGPEQLQPNRKLPTSEQAKRLFLQIKKGWLAALDRWRLVDTLSIRSHPPRDQQEALLLENARLYAKMAAIPLPEGRLLITVDELVSHWEQRTGTKRLTMSRRGITPAKMYSSVFPTAEDIRMGFHLALVGSGWNAQTMLDLQVDFDPQAQSKTPFLRNHPLDQNRYILTGFKERGKSEHDLHGDWKTDRSPGSIVKELVDRTWPLRLEVVRRLKIAEKQLRESKNASDEIEPIGDLLEPADARIVRGNVIELRRMANSVWLYLDRHGIQALSARSYAGGNPPFLKGLIANINRDRPIDIQTPDITASDFRDIYAEFIYRTTGGSIFAVQHALGHKSVATTGRYLDNTVINKLSARTFTCYTNEMWNLLETTGRLDHTILRQVVEQGGVTPAQLIRLEQYRSLKKSRLGVGCKDPKRPPLRLDPNFKPNETSLCTVQRCTLCVENAVIAPEALSGLTMRLAELRHIQARMPLDHFTRGRGTSFQFEMDNTEAALFGFPEREVQAHLSAWLKRIELGEHRVPEFQGTAKE